MKILGQNVYNKFTVVSHGNEQYHLYYWTDYCRNSFCVHLYVLQGVPKNEAADFRNKISAGKNGSGSNKRYKIGGLLLGQPVKND